MDKPTFVYTTYIQTTPQRLWQALTEPAFTERYWAITFDSDWKPDSTMTWHTRGLTIADSEQVVLKSEPYRRLSYTWPGGVLGSLISPGWPRVVANLKTLLETGDPLSDLQRTMPARLGLTQ